MKNLLLIVLLCMLVVACGQRNGSAPQDQERRDRLAAIDDSIRQMSPSVRGLVEQGLRAAKDSDTYYEYYLRYGTYHLYSSYPDSMHPYVEAVIRYAERQPATPRINTLKAEAYEAKAAYRHNLRKDVATSLKWHNKAYQALIESETPEQLPNLISNMGDAYVMLNDLPRAASAYRRALFLADSLHLPENEQITLYLGLASIYQNLGDFDETLRLYQNCYRQLGRLNHKMQIMLVNNFGNYYYYRGQYREALGKFKELEDLVKDHEGEQSYYMFLCKINLSDIYLNLDSLDKAEQYVTEADSFFRADGVATGVYYANTIRIGLCVKRQQFDGVQEILAKEHINTTIDHSLKGIRNKYLRQYYLATGNVRAAYDNKMAEDRLEDSLAEKRSYMRASEVLQRFSEDTLALHHKIAIAEKESETTEAKSIAMGLVACLVIVLLIVAVWWQSNRKRRMASEIALLKQRMENARNRISPHFVFNILNNKMVYTNQQERDELMTLSKLIRRSLDLSHSASTPLDEELRFVRDYVDLQRYVLRPDFDFRIDAPTDNELNNVEVPSMFIQILVENSIKHGLKGLDRPQSIHISVTIKKELTTITVCDNGRGFSATGHKGTGLSTMLQTINTFNLRNKRHPMDIDIHNNRNAKGEMEGCATTLTIPRNYKFN